jgi:hypothetical protein
MSLSEGIQGAIVGGAIGLVSSLGTWLLTLRHQKKIKEENELSILNEALLEAKNATIVTTDMDTLNFAMQKILTFNNRMAWYGTSFVNHQEDFKVKVKAFTDSEADMKAQQPAKLEAARKDLVTYLQGIERAIAQSLEKKNRKSTLTIY